jgi:putative spermidine/putrescine transport system substrate-binding protein
VNYLLDSLFRLKFVEWEKKLLTNPKKSSAVIPLSIALCMCFSGSVAAQEKQLVFIGYAGINARIQKEKVIPEFERRHNVRITYFESNSAQTLARLIAQKGNEDADLIVMDSPPMQQAQALGFCAPIEQRNNYNNVYGSLKLGQTAVGIQVSSNGIMYNHNYFEKKGWSPPTSWLDLADPKFKGKMLFSSANTTGTGLTALMMLNRASGGKDDNIDLGFAFIRDKIKPNILGFVSSFGQVIELFQQGEIVIIPWSSGLTVQFANTGFPVKYVQPKEGAIIDFGAVCPIKRSKNPALVQDFIDYLLSPEVQAVLVKEGGYAPANRLTQVPGDIAAEVPYGDEKMSKLIAPDWAMVYKLRPDWDKRWVREME